MYTLFNQFLGMFSNQPAVTQRQQILALLETSERNYLLKRYGSIAALSALPIAGVIGFGLEFSQVIAAANVFAKQWEQNCYLMFHENIDCGDRDYYASEAGDPSLCLNIANQYCHLGAYGIGMGLGTASSGMSVLGLAWLLLKRLCDNGDRRIEDCLSNNVCNRLEQFVTQHNLNVTRRSTFAAFKMALKAMPTLFDEQTYGDKVAATNNVTKPTENFSDSEDEDLRERIPLLSQNV